MQIFKSALRRLITDMYEILTNSHNSFVSLSRSTEKILYMLSIFPLIYPFTSSLKNQLNHNNGVPVRCFHCTVYFLYRPPVGSSKKPQPFRTTRAQTRTIAESPSPINPSVLELHRILNSWMSRF